jgi:8-oxo-dGTP diphosphatase
VSAPDLAQPDVRRPEVAVGAVCTHLGQLLLIRRGRGAAQGQWSVPGGHVEWGETLHEAVVREMYEETGLEVVVDRYLGWVERIVEPYHYVILDFAVTALDPAQAPIAGDDAAEVAWVPFAEVSDFALVGGLYEFLRDVEVW